MSDHYYSYSIMQQQQQQNLQQHLQLQQHQQQQQQQQQLHQHDLHKKHIMPIGGHNEFDYVIGTRAGAGVETGVGSNTNSSAFLATTTPAVSTIATPISVSSTSILDINNNNQDSLRYLGNGINFSYVNNVSNDRNNISKLSNNQIFIPKYGGAVACNNDFYIGASLMAMASYRGIGGNLLTPLQENSQTVAPSSTASISCQYAQTTGNASCYNRNRYVPYNHNRTCAAAAAGNSANASILSSFSSFQPLSTLYSTSSSNITPSTISSTPPLSQICVASTSLGSLIGNVVTTTAPQVSNMKGTISSFDSSNASGLVADGGSFAGAPLPLPSSHNNTKVTNSKGGPITSTPCSSGHSYPATTDPEQTVTLQITNLDYSMDEVSLRNFLMNHLRPITPVISLIFEASSYAKLTVPDLYFAKQVVSNLHRKKIGHKRMLVSYTRDSAFTEINTLRCQVAGLLKDVPYYMLPMYKFRELFQSRFKTSISVLDLYKMQDICSITTDSSDEKFINLQPELISSLESSPLMEGLQHSVPYCTIHFKREQHKGWAEQDIEPLPNVFMTISEIQEIIYPLLKSHPGDIPIASLVHCIESELKGPITPNENGVNLEHLVCCVQGIQIQMNNFGIKILNWLELHKENLACSNNGGLSNGLIERNGLVSKNSLSDPLYQISREVTELLKMSPKSTMKFNRFIPAYHNHFGKQCRVADYGYTKLIELFEALSSVVQIMGDGENRQITLTHRTQIRRFTSDLLRVIRAHGNKSVLLSQWPTIFAQTQNRNFDVTDYGVCDIGDILDGLVNSNIVALSTVQNGKDILISVPKRKQTNAEIEKTCIFAGEMVELFRNAPQYTILFQKFVRSYHYHFAYQCRLSDYGFLKLADLMEAIHGIVELELTNDEDKKILLSPIIARRVFAEQCEELILCMTGSSNTCMKLDEVLKLHKKKYGYQILPQTLGVEDFPQAVESMPYVELLNKDSDTWIICHSGSAAFRGLCYRVCKQLMEGNFEKLSKSYVSNKQLEASPKNSTNKSTTMDEFIKDFEGKYKRTLTKSLLQAMKPLIEVSIKNEIEYLHVTNFTVFLMNIVHLLEQRPSMLVNEIKNALYCNITTTFEFGFPNLFSIFTSYSDIFTINLGCTQERSEISLKPNSELRTVSTNFQRLSGSASSIAVFSKPKTTTRPVRQPLTEYNGRQINIINQPNGPPAKTRAINSNDLSSVTTVLATYCPPNATTTNHTHCEQFNYSINQQLNQVQNNLCHQDQQTAMLTGKHDTSNSSIYSNFSHHSELNHSTLNLSNSNKENSLNSSINLHGNTSFNTSTNTSFSELNYSTIGDLSNAPVDGSNVFSNLAAASAMIPSTSKLWDRRLSSLYTQRSVTEHNTSIAATVNPNGLPALYIPSHSLSELHIQGKQEKIATIESADLGELQGTDATGAVKNGLYDFVRDIQMRPLYEPPKPDTPPKNIPFWSDPIWTNNNSNTSEKDELLNIKLPELKGYDELLPMVLSPYTISKNINMRRQLFNFETPDRKIA